MVLDLVLDQFAVDVLVLCPPVYFGCDPIRVAASVVISFTTLEIPQLGSQQHRVMIREVNGVCTRRFLP